MSSLTDMYDNIKKETSGRPLNPTMAPTDQVRVPSNVTQPSTHRMALVRQEADKLKEDCAKQLLIKLYLKVLPMDSDHIQGNQGQMSADVDNLLASRGQTAMQYLTSAKERTQAQMLEFVLRSIDNIGKMFIEEAEAEAKEASESGMNIPRPEANANSQAVQNQLVEIESDLEYSTFIERLREKTTNRVVEDVTNVIKSEKDKKQMAFDLPDKKTESALLLGMNHIQEKLMKENVEPSAELQDFVMGLAIRESTLNEIARMFRDPDSKISTLTSSLKHNKGLVINEAAIAGLQDFFFEKVLSDSSNLQDLNTYIEYSNQIFNQYDLLTEGSGAGKGNIITRIIDAIRRFINTKIKPLLRKWFGKGEANQSIISAMAKAGINPDPKTFMAGSTQVDAAAEVMAGMQIDDDTKRFDQDSGKMKGQLQVLNLERISEVVGKWERAVSDKGIKISRLEKTKFMAQFLWNAGHFIIESEVELNKYANNISSLVIRINNINQILINNPETPNGDLLRDNIMLLLNMLNMNLAGVFQYMSVRLNPLTDHVLDQFKDMDKMIKFTHALLDDKTMGGNLTGKILEKIFDHLGWEHGSGQSRVFTANAVGKDMGIKLARNRKGMADNITEADLFRKFSGQAIGKHLIPVELIDKAGVAVKVPVVQIVAKTIAMGRHSLLGGASEAEIVKFISEVKRDSPDNVNLSGDVEGNWSNIGKLGDKLVIIDYANVFLGKGSAFKPFIGV